MTDETTEYLKSKRQLRDAYQYLAKVSRTLPEDLGAIQIVEQLGARVDRFVGQPWPAKVNAGIAKVYNDLAHVITEISKSTKHREARKRKQYERLLARRLRFPSLSKQEG